MIDVTDQAQREGRLEEVQQFLKEELDRIFSGGVSLHFFAVLVHFEFNTQY